MANAPKKPLAGITVEGVANLAGLLDVFDRIAGSAGSS
jgi:hypothetical protein